MNELHVTPIYAALLAILMAVLSTWTGIQRGRSNVALGHGDDAALSLAIRRFGNLSEYAAMAALILLLMEMQGIADTWLHLYGGLLVAFRLLHPVALYAQPTVPLWRKAGRFVSAAGTAALLLAGGVAILI